MKRIKLLSLFMAVIVILLGSGCGAGLSEKKIEEYIQRLPYQKLLADKYQPELPGYELEFRESKGSEKAREDGYSFSETFKYRTTEIDNKNVACVIKHKYGITTFQLIEIDDENIDDLYSFDDDTVLKEFSIKIESVYGSDFFFRFEYLFYQDGEFFALTNIVPPGPYYLYYYYDSISACPVALYKVDFELEKVYYLGYAKGWFEHVEEIECFADSEIDNSIYDYRVIKRTE